MRSGTPARASAGFAAVLVAFAVLLLAAPGVVPGHGWRGSGAAAAGQLRACPGEAVQCRAAAGPTVCGECAGDGEPVPSGAGRAAARTARGAGRCAAPVGLRVLRC
ncbi:hypothetical protein ACIQGZ_04590 [Streptomyces sp. NPDC092296]|uniref:hypothetical protein n=1 Tax=Streptomyces sp. NPDC092296 TaxID=3366012 RepID=UPI003807F1D6